MDISVKYGTREIIFSLSYAKRKTLQIAVNPDMSVNVTAPENASISEIKHKILKRSRWILKQQIYFEQFLPRTPAREYVSGETHLYLGRHYLLRIRKSSINSVKLIGGELLVSVIDIDNKQSAIQLLTKWYYKHSKDKFEGAIKKYLPSFKQFNLESPSWEIKRMAKRWGSCTSKGKILFNPELIKAPVKCIEYVTVHELCHLMHHSHNKDFYYLQTQIMPNWEKWKKRLEEISA